MHKHILIVNGHPDPNPVRFCTTLCEAYGDGVEEADQEPQLLNLGAPIDRATASANDVAAAIAWADKIAIVFPLWLDAPPPALSRILTSPAKSTLQALCRSKVVRVIVTMSMPAFIYRGISRVPDCDQTPWWMNTTGSNRARYIFIGSADALSLGQREDWLTELRLLGARDAHSQQWSRALPKFCHARPKPTVEQFAYEANP